MTLHPALIPEHHMINACRPGAQDETCAFLVMDFTGATPWRCAKGTSIQTTILHRLEVGTMVAKSDNCLGWPIVLVHELIDIVRAADSPDHKEGWSLTPTQQELVDMIFEKA